MGFGFNLVSLMASDILRRPLSFGGALQDLGDVFDDIVTYAEDLADSGSSMKSRQHAKKYMQRSTSSVGGMFVTWNSH